MTTILAVAVVIFATASHFTTARAVVLAASGAAALGGLVSIASAFEESRRVIIARRLGKLGHVERLSEKLADQIAARNAEKVLDVLIRAEAQLRAAGMSDDAIAAALDEVRSTLKETAAKRRR